MTTLKDLIDRSSEGTGDTQRMGLKVGSKVTIKKNLGPKNRNNPGDEDCFYFPDGPYLEDVPLGSKGRVTKIEGEQIWIKIRGDPDEDEMYYDEYPFHKSELEFPDEVADTGLGKLPTAKVFSLASKVPVFLINERVYTLEEPGEPNENFYQLEKKGKQVRHSLVESATLSSLERLAQQQHAKDFDKLQMGYLQTVFEEGAGELENSNKRYVLLDFIVNKVFPYLRGKGGDEKKLAKLLGIKIEKVEEPKTSEQAPEKEPKEDPIIKKIVKEIEKEKLPGQKKRGKTKLSKLDELLGGEPETVPSGQDYTPDSMLGKALGGRNAVIVKGAVYYLAAAEGLPDESYVNIDGKNFTLVSEEKAADLKARYDFELSKQVRIDALKVKYAEQKRIGQLKNSDSSLEALLKKKSYKEEDFGFIFDDGTYDPEEDGGFRDSYHEEESNYEDGEPSYWVFIQVPEHVLKMPEDEKNDYSYYNYGRKDSEDSVDQYFHFDPVRLAVRVYVGVNGKITYDAYPATVEDYEHPFSGSGRFSEICMGDYDRSKLSKLQEGEAIARLLIDGRKTLTSGYVSDVAPNIHLSELSQNAITLAEVKKRKLPITNININEKD